MRPRPTDTTVEDVAEPAPVVSDSHPAPATDEAHGASQRPRHPALETGRLPNLARFQDQSHDAAGVLASREVDLMVYDHYLALDARWSARFARYAALHHEWDRRTVALFVGPIPPDQRGARS